MPKRSSKGRKAKDPNVRAFQVVQESTEDAEEQGEPEAPAKPEKNPAAVALGRLGGKKGGKARAKKLSAKRRSEIARAAAMARWKKDNN